MWTALHTHFPDTLHIPDSLHIEVNFHLTYFHSVVFLSSSNTNNCWMQHACTKPKVSAAPKQNPHHIEHNSQLICRRDLKQESWIIFFFSFTTLFCLYFIQNLTLIFFLPVGKPLILTWFPNEHSTLRTVLTVESLHLFHRKIHIFRFVWFPKQIQAPGNQTCW